MQRVDLEISLLPSQVIHIKSAIPKRPEKISFVADPKAIATLKRLANEAEIVFHFDLTTRYYQECLVLCDWDPELWYEYAMFALRSRNVARAEECLLEAVQLDPKHFDSLLVYGCILAQNGEVQKAEAFLRGAESIEPDNGMVKCILVRAPIKTVTS